MIIIDDPMIYIDDPMIYIDDPMIIINTIGPSAVAWDSHDISARRKKGGGLQAPAPSAPSHAPALFSAGGATKKRYRTVMRISVHHLLSFVVYHLAVFSNLIL